MNKFVLTCVGVIVGAAVTAAAIPSPANKHNCDIYRVAHPVETAFVLKPPPAGHVVIKETCPAPEVKEAGVDPEKIEDQPRRRRWRHIKRRHWR